MKQSTEGTVYTTACLCVWGTLLDSNNTTRLRAAKDNSTSLCQATTFSSGYRTSCRPQCPLDWWRYSCCVTVAVTWFWPKPWTPR